MKNTSHKLFTYITAIIVLWFSTGAYAVTMLIDSLSGPVTQNEINSFKTFMASEPIPQTPWGALNGTNGAHNLWADGNAGRELEAMGAMYEVSGDIAILNQMVSWVDICISQRNDLMSSANGGQRVMWTGVIDKVWCPDEPTSSDAKYAGCENEDTEGHIAYCAKLILQNPSLWNTTVPDGNPKGYGVTYLDRAKTYLAKCDEANDEYSLKWFIKSGSNLIRPPTNSAWTAIGENVTAINRQQMFNSGFQRLAEAHELLGDNPARVAQYDAIVQASVDECLNGMINYDPYTVGGHPVYNWSYYPTSTSGTETTEIHAEYDIIGVYRAFTRSAYGYDLSTLAPFANTMLYVIYLGTNTFAGDVHGGSGTQSPIYSGWLYPAEWNSAVYDTVAGAAFAKGTYKSKADIMAGILWAKNRRYLQFGVAADPDSASVKSGSSVPYTVTLTPMGGFRGTVNFTVSGLPTGATGSFSPSSINLSTINSYSTNSILTVSTSTSTPGGTYTLTITGTSGSVSHSTTVTLVVSDFTISATPASQTVNAGNATNYTVTVGNINAFSGSIALSASGLPSGATASFNPASVTAPDSSTMTLTTAVSTSAGTNTINVKGTSGSLSRSANVTLIVNAPVLPSGWTDADIGAVGVAGSASYSGTTFTVNGSGSDIWGTSDLFNYVYQSTPGDLAVTARAASQEATSGWAKAGVMIRESTAANSRYIGIYITPSNGVSMQLRATTGAGAIDFARQTGLVAPYWVKLVRSGSTFSGYSSPDGTSWTLVGSTNVTMAASTTAGLTVCAHDNTQLNTSTFDNVTVANYAFFEAESLTVVTNSQSVTNIPDANCSGGQFVQLNGVAVGDLIKFLVPGITAGTYDVRVGVKKNYNRAIVQTMAGRVGGSYNPLGSTFDEYNATATYPEIDVGSWTVSTSDKYVGFNVTGKNASATSYVISIDYIKLVPQ